MKNKVSVNLNERNIKKEKLRISYFYLYFSILEKKKFGKIPHQYGAGANMIVSGTAIIQSVDQKAVIASLRETVESSIHKCNV
ncbi:hypothetical protein NQ317_017065 [Molorchus minor]|uniref:Uncharacterized protein n=1 Tax=Molorchus minor TaxID=1323400 RepID=A0ABQ9K739_9CUCU|nr:hypothetical protein NQ317_017065 [Molorchus minor]